MPRRTGRTRKPTFLQPTGAQGAGPTGTGAPVHTLGMSSSHSDFSRSGCAPASYKTSSFSHLNTVSLLVFATCMTGSLCAWSGQPLVGWELPAQTQTAGGSPVQQGASLRNTQIHWQHRGAREPFLAVERNQDKLRPLSLSWVQAVLSSCHGDRHLLQLQGLEMWA